MDRIKIIGGSKLIGSIPISGAKNAALPLMIASLLSEGTLTLKNIPHLADITLLSRILGDLGANITIDGRGSQGVDDEISGVTMHINVPKISNFFAKYELVSKMRAGFWVIGPLLARTGRAKVSLPGGCAIGTRPVDLHLKALQELGADIKLEDGYVNAAAPNGLKGARIKFPKVSVGATHNILMASTLASGQTIIENAAKEPEVVDLVRCLRAMGANIEGEGTSVINIEGVTQLNSAEHTVLPDRIEAGTYAMAVAMTGGSLTLMNVNGKNLQYPLNIMKAMGVECLEHSNNLHITQSNNNLKPIDIETNPYPGFPTDLQAQIMAMMTQADGLSRIRETIFENRFMHVQELARLGADITLDGDMAIIKGVTKLQGAQVMATDLRASVSLVIAALAAKGETIVNRVYHLDRGFEDIEKKLSRCGAIIERLTD
ncbi:MAG: UDP-N-acetylglucosamine 1-carboxyvinyltransferase [Alphaproteobacteria bacterium]|jgi:UDP-N-acetylglucosamine 1-carboxyvinyltransferase